MRPLGSRKESPRLPRLEDVPFLLNERRQIHQCGHVALDQPELDGATEGGA